MESFLSFWSSNFIINLFSRLLSFISNQFLVRLLDRALFGVWSIRLSLISETIVFWARDGVRKAAAKSEDQESHKRYAIIPFFIGIIITPIILYISFRSAPNIEGYMYASTLTCVAALIELVGEFWCVPQLSQLQGGIVAKVTAPAYLLRSLVAVLLTKFFYNSTVTLMIIFGFCNLLFSLCIVVGFLFRCGKPLISLPTKVEFLSLRPFVVQTIIQWLFSQGERLLLTSSYNDDQIGVYGMVSDLCSLVARIIFAPIESSAFSLFAKSQNPPIEVLQICCRFVIYIGLLASSYGPVLGPVVLRKVYGPKWSGDDVKSVLSAFCRIMPFMALNGVTEAFPNARLPRNKLEVYNRKLLIVNVIYLTMMYWLGKIFGPHGAVYANGVAMSIRSCMAIHVIYLECGQAVKTIFPSAIVLAVLLLLSIFGNMLGAIVMIITIPIVAGIIIVFEKELLKKLIGMFRRTRKD